MVTLVAIAFAASPADQSPNVTSKSNHAAKRIYVDAITVSMASVARFNPDFRRIVVTDLPHTFRELDARIVYQRFNHRPSVPLYRTFSASLYLIDAFYAILDQMDDEDDVLFIDPDCLIVGNLSPIVETVRAAGVAALPMDYPSDRQVNGLSGLQASLVGSRIDGHTSVPVHYGGELYGFSKGGLRSVLTMVEAAYEAAAQDAMNQTEPRFTTEEHIMNYALARTSDVASLSIFAKRVWTARRYRNVSGDEANLLIWHLPAEKARGFRRLRRVQIDSEAWFWTAPAEDYRSRAARVMGIDRSCGRRAVDLVARLAAYFTASVT